MECKYCNKRCHYPCTECTDDADKMHCHAMKNEYCSKRGCHWTYHALKPFIFEMHEVEREIILEGMKKNMKKQK